MNSPKLQFTTRSLLLATAVVAITLAGTLGAHSILEFELDERLLMFAFVIGSAPFWMPVEFTAYAIGRRALTVGSVVVFVLLEASAVAATFWVSTL